MLNEKIKHMASTTKLTNSEIATQLRCSERSVRRYAGEWKKRVKTGRIITDFTGGERKAFVIADVHIPYQNPVAYSIALEYGVQWEPDDVIILGDLCDFKTVSFWKDDPGRRDFMDEVEEAKAALFHIRRLFPTQRIIFVEGNHEARLSKYLWTKAPELYRLPELSVPILLDLPRFDIEYVSNIHRLTSGEQPFSIGKLFLLHGHELKVSWDGVNLARTFYLKAHTNVLFAHFHQSQQYIAKKLDGSHEQSCMIGGLCRLSEPYAPANNWVNGFATVKYEDSTGLFKLRNKIIIHDRVL